MDEFLNQLSDNYNQFEKKLKIERQLDEEMEDQNVSWYEYLQYKKFEMLKMRL